jgi:hypothetical protein
VAVIRTVRAHLDVAVAVILALAYVAWVALAPDVAAGPPIVAGMAAEDALVHASALAFLLSLALRTRVPLVPLGLAFVALVGAGRGRLEDSPVLLAGVVLAAYSVAAWSAGRAALVGALGVGGLAGLVVLRAVDIPVQARDAAVPVVLIVGAWALGLAARSIRAERGDERVVGDIGWEGGDVERGDPAHDALVRDLRDLIERSMSTVVLRSRAARAALRREPARAEQALAAIEAAGTEALQETQRLTGLLLSPDGAQLAMAPNGMRDLDELTVQVADAGLPVSTRIEGRPVPLSPDLDGVAFHVIHAALLNALDGAESGEAGVVVRYGRDELQVEVTDDGLPVEGGSEQGAAGLLAVRDEVAALGGTLDAGPGEERGYWVLARLPYEPDDLA